MKKHEGETMSSFNRRFANFYYNMPKEIQPLEGVAKLHYVSFFPPELSLFPLERKLVTLQSMFVDSLEVKENLRMSRSVLDHGSNDRSDKELEMAELHDTKEMSSHPFFQQTEKGSAY